MVVIDGGICRIDHIHEVVGDSMKGGAACVLLVELHDCTGNICSCLGLGQGKTNVWG